MAVVLQPWNILVAALAGWITQHQDKSSSFFAKRIEFSNNNSVANDSG